MTGASKDFRFDTDWRSRVEELGLTPAAVEFFARRDRDLEDYLQRLPLKGFNVETGFTTDANGRIAILHHLPRIPAAIDAFSLGPDGGGTILGMVVVAASSIDDVQFIARCFDTAGAPLGATTGLTLGWIALG